MAAAGIELRRAGRGFFGCCPFHDDGTASMSVAAVPDRFNCFGCGAHGDVIDFVQRLHGLTFIDAIDTLTANSPIPTLAGRAQRRLDGLGPPPSLGLQVTGVTAERGFAINALAWRHLSVSLRAEFAEHYLLHHRGIDLRPLHAQLNAQPNAEWDPSRRAEDSSQRLVGYAGHGWTTLVDDLRRDGVTDDELTVMDLAQRTRDNRLVDTLRDRIIVPVRDADHRIRGFIGRDISGNPRAPKYRNPTHTPTFDKSQILYRPTQHALNPGGTVVIVEGVLDALAIAAHAAATGRSRRLAPCAANGVTASTAQVHHILGLAREAHCVIALDGDQAGDDGTTRWLQALTIEHGKVAYLTPLPAGTDPADWLRAHPHDGLDAFDHDRTIASLATVAPYLNPRRLTRLAAGVDPNDQIGTDSVGAVNSGRPAAEAVTNACRHLIPLVDQLPTTGRWLLEQSESEMTRLGLNAAGEYTAALHRHPEAHTLLTTPAPAAEPVEGGGADRADGVDHADGVDRRKSQGLEL